MEVRNLRRERLVRPAGSKRYENTISYCHWSLWRFEKRTATKHMLGCVMALRGGEIEELDLLSIERRFCSKLYMLEGQTRLS